MELYKEKLEAIEKALDLLYPDEILRKILEAKTSSEITRALQAGRESI